jgi:hypothetical protein
MYFNLTKRALSVLVSIRKGSPLPYDHVLNESYSGSGLLKITVELSSIISERSAADHSRLGDVVTLISSPGSAQTILNIHHYRYLFSQFLNA